MENNEMPSAEDIMAAFGITDTDTSTDVENPPEGNESADTSVNTADTNEPDSSSETNTADAEGGASNQNTQEHQEQQVQTKANTDTVKQNQAFARMRSENAQMQKALSQMAEVLGLDPKMPMDQLTLQMQSQARNALAKKQGIDPAIAERLDNLEQINAEYTKIKVQQHMMNSMDVIRNKFGATEDDLKAFVNDLIRDGYQPTESSDFVNEFISRNFDAILKKHVDAAVSAEQARAAKAGGASNPGKAQGQSKQAEQSDVKSVQDLEQFLNNL